MELQGEWPEPVVSVQSLLAGGALTAIPERYVKPPSQRPAPPRPVVSPADLPLVDLVGLTAGSTAAEVVFQATVHRISDACKEWGFFQVVNHGVSPELQKRMMGAWREFFLLPPAEKQVYANSPRTYEGYGSRIGVEKGVPLDWSDYFFLNFLPLSTRNYDKWPAAFPPLIRETVEEYGREVVKLAQRLVKVLSVGLGLEAGRLQKAFGGGGGDEVDVGIRVNYYPKCPQPELTLGLSSHSDPGGLTILLADDHVKGLQVKKGGGWVTVTGTKACIGDRIM